MKSLKEMTIEELWELFPIVLVPHNTQWANWTKEEIASLTVLLSGYDTEITHIGSTAISSIKAKPIIDILVEIPPDADIDKLRLLMESSGYICMSSSTNRASFNKGYTPQGYSERVFHIHFHRKGDNDEIYFRDFLLSHPDFAKEYEQLKLSLLPAFKHNRDAYTEAKSSFIHQITALAKTSS